MSVELPGDIKARTEADIKRFAPREPTQAQLDEWARNDVLNLPEWYQPMSNSSGSCPWCENMRHWGHAEDCQRRVVLDILKAALA